MRFDHISLRPEGQKDSTLNTTQYYGQPVCDGRFFRLNIYQTPLSEATLENLQLAGGINPVTVNGKPGIYQAQCWDSTA